MAQAISAYRHISATDELKEIERARHYARHNEASALAYAEESGELKRAHEVAKNLLAMGMEVDKVVAATGLDLNEVLKLKGEK